MQVVLVHLLAWEWQHSFIQSASTSFSFLVSNTPHSNSAFLRWSIRIKTFWAERSANKSFQLYFLWWLQGEKMPLQQYPCRCLSLWIALTRYSYSIKQKVFKVPSEGLNIFWKQLLLFIWKVHCEEKSCFKAAGADSDSSPWALFTPFYPTNATSSPDSCICSCTWLNQLFSFAVSHCLPFGNSSAVKNIRLAGNTICFSCCSFCFVFCKAITFSSKCLASYKPGNSSTWNSVE